MNAVLPTTCQTLSIRRQTGLVRSCAISRLGYRSSYVLKIDSQINHGLDLEIVRRLLPYLSLYRYKSDIAEGSHRYR